MTNGKLIPLPLKLIPVHAIHLTVLFVFALRTTQQFSCPLVQNRTVSSNIVGAVMGDKRISNGGTTKMFWRYLKIRGLVITSDQDCMRYLPCHNLLIYYAWGGCGH